MKNIDFKGIFKRILIVLVLIFIPSIISKLVASLIGRENMVHPSHNLDIGFVIFLNWCSGVIITIILLGVLIALFRLFYWILMGK